MREAMFAGSFYEKGFNQLDKQITECFNHEKGPGDLPLHKREKKLKAVIAPHAGYVYSGPCAAWAYKDVAEAEFPDVYIVIGPNHASNGSYVSTDMWQTPFGEVRVDKDLVKAILKQNDQLKVNEHAHQKEHSIEVQLPFLQFATKDKMHELKILPIIVDNDIDYKKLALDIKEALVEMDRKAVFIVSSDFTHYGRDYKYVPFSENVHQKIYDMDKEAIEFIKNLDPDGFLDYTFDKITTICGQMAIAIALKSIKASQVNMEQYYTSADITDGEYKNSVSYASISFY